MVIYTTLGTSVGENVIQGIIVNSDGITLNATLTADIDAGDLCIITFIGRRNMVYSYQANGTIQAHVSCVAMDSTNRYSLIVETNGTLTRSN
jgi:hypothetical protein